MGSIVKVTTANGGTAYRARVRVDGKQIEKRFARKVEATKWIASVSGDAVRGEYVAAERGRITLASYYALWAPDQLWAPRTRQAMDLAVRQCPFADKPLGEVRRTDVEAWVKAMSRELAPATVRLRVANVRNVLRAAVRDKRITADPAEGVPLPRLRKLEASMRIPTPEQVAALLRHSVPSWPDDPSPEDFTGYIAVMALAGLRSGEAAGLQVGDVDYSRRVLHVRRQVQSVPGDRTAVNPPKHGSERRVPLSKGLADMLRVYTDGRASGEFLFRRRDGRLYNDNAAWHQFRQIANLADVKDVTPHDLRHYFASGLIAAGRDVVSVQHALGHHSPAVTLGRYSHLWPNAADKTREALDDMAAVLLTATITTAGNRVRAD